MNTEQQRIAIAQACGYKDVAIRLNEGTIKVMTGFKNHRFDEEVPDYLNDLNAMHEAESLLAIYGNEKLPKKYTQQIKAAICREAGVRKAQMDFDVCITATAAQRAEAFLRTLGLWEEVE